MIQHGDLFDVLPTLDAESIDACVTDPPYGIGFMGKEWDSFLPATAAKKAGLRQYGRLPRWKEDNPNLKGRKVNGAISASQIEYDRTVEGQRAFQEWTERWAREVYRVLKPGAHLLVCGAPRSFHRMMCGLEDAGFVVRDCLSWLYGQGFPKSLNLGNGQGTALKPGWEPIVLARKPFSGTLARNVDDYKTGALNIAACRIDGPPSVGGLHRAVMGYDGGNPRGRIGVINRELPDGRWPANVVLDEWHERVLYLKYNLPDETTRLIWEYFDGYSNVPTMRERLRDVSCQGEAGQGVVLQAGLLRDVAEREPARRATSDDGPAPQRGIDREDASVAEGTRDQRREQPSVEGRQAHLARIRDGGAVAVVAEGTEVVRDDGESEQQSVHPGTPARGCAEVGPSTTPVGSGASLEREQAGQPAPESRAARQRHAQADPQGDPSRATEASERERTIEIRTLEVLESDIPRGWLTYFTDTGTTIRRGAAAMLDEQAPFTGAAGAKDNRGRPHGFADGRTSLRDDNWGDPLDDRSGASRFFYVAKPSREERDYGTHGLTERQRDDSRKAGNPGGDNPRNRGLQPRGNFHPTVKPIELMRWLVRLVTPVGGTVLDPFTGSGTTGMACRYELREFVGIEREAEYVGIAEARIAAVAPLFSADTGSSSCV